VTTRASGVILEKPLSEIVNALEVVPAALSSPVSGELDLAEKVLWIVDCLFRRDHTSETEALLEEGPAIETIQIDRRRLDMIVNLQGEIFVGKPMEFASEPDDAISDREFSPLFLLGLRDDLPKTILSFEDQRFWKLPSFRDHLGSALNRNTKGRRAQKS
jgi:hypothetical protein